MPPAIADSDDEDEIAIECGDDDSSGKVQGSKVNEESGIEGYDGTNERSTGSTGS